MYTTCMFCRKPLGANELVEAFPVGRRLAFDAAKGRLWVVCRRCERWNLTPLEERWEAVEECEKVFRESGMRVSTGNIGLARHPEGLTLVRVGKPLRPEFAAWRYGDQIAKRYRRGLVLSITGGTIGGVAGAVLGTTALPVMVPAAVALVVWEGLRSQVGIKPSGESVAGLSWLDIWRARLYPTDDGVGMRIELPRLSYSRDRRLIAVEGDEARHVAAMIAARVNHMGADWRVVRQAVGLIQSAGHPDAFLAEVAAPHTFRRTGRARSLLRMPPPTRLALEMALHEEHERRALEGELWLLERAWREAEEIAAIADNLLLPKGAEQFIRRHRRSDESPEG